MAATALTPALMDLMEHEKVIEQGLATFVDVGNALVAIRDGKKYRACGHQTFEAYCSKRWGFARSTAYQMMEAADTVSLLSANADILEPRSEGQIRHLSALRDDPEQLREAWVEAVDNADGGQPTGQQVKAAVERRIPPKKDHPAAFSDRVLDTIADHVRGSGTVLDPFAGTGRVHELSDRGAVDRTIGVELEPEWAAKHPDTLQGNALDLSPIIAPESVDAIATSPTYGNRMADHHDATDDSVRLTYKHTLGRDLSDDNSGAMQWGDEYRDFHRKAWAESVAVLRSGGTFTINIKNHVRGGEVQRVAEWHIDVLMHEFGLHLEALDVVPTRGLMAGANADTRTGHELVATFRKPS